MTAEEYAQLLEGFICQSWLWPDFICFGIEHGRTEDEIEKIRGQINDLQRREA